MVVGVLDRRYHQVGRSREGIARERSELRLPSRTSIYFAKSGLIG
jgi:hypothetical protein